MTADRLAALPWHRETIGHASIDEIAASIHASLAIHADNTDATWIIDSENRIVAFIGNGPRQTENGDLIIKAVAAGVTVTPQPDGLDVERLARAQHLASLGYTTLTDAASLDLAAEWVKADSRRLAQATAAIYAALEGRTA